MRHTIHIILLLLPMLLGAQSLSVFDSLQLVHSDTLFFASGQWSLDSTAQWKIATIPFSAKANQKIHLTAHTDAIGSHAYNEDLALKRAKSVEEQLRLHNWPAEAVVRETFGERRPQKNNNNDYNRQLNRRVTLDIYQEVPFYRIVAKVKDPQTDELLPNVNIKVRSRSNQDSLTTNEKGEAVLKLAIDSIYGIDVFAKDYFFISKMMKVRLELPPVLELELPKAQIGDAADLSMLYFVGNEAILLEKSKPELPKIQRFLEVNNHLKVEIAGHVNYPNRPPVTEDTFEWDLSVRRAKFLHDWLLTQDIPADQITYKGYGNHEMRFPNAVSSQEQSLNRRVEIRILGER